MNLRNIVFTLWNTNFERKGIQQEFKPIFTRFIGVDNVNENKDIVKTLIHKANQNSNNTLFFQNKIELDVDFEFIMNINKELENMNLLEIKSNNLKMFESEFVNDKFLEALDYVIKLANQNNELRTKSLQISFVSRILMLTYSYIRSLTFDEEKANKIIYIGEIQKYDVYFLIYLFKFGFDVVYINPEKDVLLFEQIDVDKLSILDKGSSYDSFVNCESYTRTASLIRETVSSLVNFDSQIENELYTNGVYKDWQFKKYNTENLFFNSTLIDLENNWSEQARLRNGFEVKNQTVSIPNFFFEIEGVYNDMSKYNKFCSKLKNEPNTLFSENFFSEFYSLNDVDKKSLDLIFLRNGDGTYSLETLQESPLYNYSKYNDDTELFIIKKINETINSVDLFKEKLTDEEKLKIAYILLNLNNEVIRVIDSFDFSKKIPKAVLFLKNDDELKREHLYFIAFLNKVGFDLVILSPAGVSNLSSVIYENKFNTERLENIKYDLTKIEFDDKIEKKKSNGFWSKLF